MGRGNVGMLGGPVVGVGGSPLLPPPERGVGGSGGNLGLLAFAWRCASINRICCSRLTGDCCGCWTVVGIGLGLNMGLIIPGIAPPVEAPVFPCGSRNVRVGMVKPEPGAAVGVTG